MSETFCDRELRNNNQRGGVPACGDANANEIQTEDGATTDDIATLSGLMTETAQQDKVIIWGTDSQFDDPELAEFEMLECQELEAYLVEDGQDFVGIADRTPLQGQRSSCSKDTVEQVLDNKSRGERKSVPHGASEQESSAAHVSDCREVTSTELSSETDVFVTCLSTISSMDAAMDTASRTQTTDSWNMASGPYSTISEDLTLVSQNGNNITERVEASPRADHPSLSSGDSTIHGNHVDMNWNSAVKSEVVMSQTQVGHRVELCDGAIDEHRNNKNQGNKAGNTIFEGDFYRRRSTEHKGSHAANNISNEESTQADESPVVKYSPPKTGTKGAPSPFESKATKTQGSFDTSLRKQNSFDRSFKKQQSFENTMKKQHSFDNSLKKQGSFERSATSSSSLDRRKPWGSPSRPATPTSPKTTSCSPGRQRLGSPAKVQSIRALSFERSDSPQRGSGQSVRHPIKTTLSSCIPKPVTSHQKEPEPIRTSPHKPKNVRPKIITYVRKNPQAKQQGTDAPLEVPALPLRLSSYSCSSAQNSPKVGPQTKYQQEMQKRGGHPAGTAATGVKPSSSTIPRRLGGKSGSFHEEMSEKYLHEHVSEEGGSAYRSPRALRPQLGLGAVTRQPAAKTRVQQAGQRSAPVPGQNFQASTHGSLDRAGEQKRSGERCPEAGSKSVLLKSGQSGLRPPGFSGLPVARLGTFGFVRTTSVSSASSNQSYQSSHSDPCRPSPHPEPHNTPPHSATAPRGEASHAQSRPPPPSAPGLQHRSLPPQRSSPLAGRREIQKDTEAAVQPMSSPKRFAVVSPKPQSPVCGRTAAVQGAFATTRAQELDRILIQRLRERCEQQDLQLQSLQAQLKKASLCLDVFSITTQHFSQKSESAVVKERELSLELARIRDEVAFSVAHWEQLQQEKEELERRFEAELQGLRARQQRELGGLEERLKAQHTAEAKSLQAQQRDELGELRLQQQEQIEEMSENHEASLMEMETAHDNTLATLQDEHARTVKNLKMAHEQQTRSLGEEFEKIRLSLQDQVDTLTFQNRSLRDRAKRFEEALRKSTDEQIVDALAPYKHIDEDLKSLKDVLEMKNQQIHQQELKISELEKIAEKNVYLEERVQVLQQQNEDLKERIDKNLAVSRQLSEDNASLQVHVEKESNEKKRLSRNNEELLWRLQTGELSPRMSPSASPIHRPLSGPGSPARPHSYHQ
ncbi:microtubule-associated tumor suppressor candidate 2 isoform 2-T4 [Spinachia spinachia]